MKLFPQIAAFVIATTLAFSAPAQDSCNYSTLTVPEDWANQLRDHAQILANNYSNILNKKITVVPLRSGSIQSALHEKTFYSNDGSQLALLIMDPVAEIPDFLKDLKIVCTTRTGKPCLIRSRRPSNTRAE